MSIYQNKSVQTTNQQHKSILKTDQKHMHVDVIRLIRLIRLLIRLIRCLIRCLIRLIRLLIRLIRVLIRLIRFLIRFMVDLIFAVDLIVVLSICGWSDFEFSPQLNFATDLISIVSCDLRDSSFLKSVSAIRFFIHFGLCSALCFSLNI